MNGPHPLQQYIPQQTTRQQPMQQMSQGMQFQNPVQKMNYIMQAMKNPAAFVKQNLPGIPDQIVNNPESVLQYMRKNYGVTDADIQQAASQIPQFPMF